MSVYHTSRRFTLLSLSYLIILYFRDLLSLYFFFTVPSQSAGREERDLEGSYCTVKPGWKRRIPSDLRS